MTLGELGSPVLVDLNCSWFAVLVSSCMSICSLALAIYNALTHTKQRPRFMVLLGLIPLLLLASMFVLIFTFTEWAWTHCGYVTLMSTPVIGLINSRTIVCNFAGMTVDYLPKTPMWYLLFPLNHLPSFVADCPFTAVQQGSGSKLLVDEGYLALFVFVVTASYYFWWVTGTIK